MDIRKNILSIAFVILFFGCSSDENNQNFKYDSDKQMLQSVVDSLITPQLNSFYQETINLQSLYKSFAKEINSKNLTALQSQWLVVAKSYAKVYAFNIGDVKRQYFNLWINNWPINAEGFEKKMATDQEIDANYVKKLGSDVKGILAIQYLLFKEQKDETITVFLASKNRLNTLKFIIDELVLDAENQEKIWKEYAPNFIQKDVDTGSIDNSFNILFNGLNNVIHYAWETKIGKPSGFEKSGVNVQNLEAPYSKKSLELIKANVAITKEVFFSDSIVSIADKIRFVTKNDDLNDTIKLQYEKIEQAIAVIDKPLYDAVITDTDKVKTLYKELKRLEVLFSTDVRSTLSLIITGTDGDGD